MKVSSGKPPGKVRIIGGRWRGRKLPVSDTAGLRPTPDRLRETLFNWLAPFLPGATCLDLFAGSGALGLEALSRGAAGAVLVERDDRVLKALRTAVTRLAAKYAEVVQADALHWLQHDNRRYDVIFLDPPFDSDLLARSLALVMQRDILKPGGLVYLEFPRDRAPDPGQWPQLEHYRDGRAGEAGCLLLRRVPQERAVTV